MTILIKDLTFKNFLSVGNVTQAISLDRADLTLVLGENLDLGGNGNRNGVGKSTILQAISYALYGESINSIRKDHLINRTNGKGMMVSLTFSVNGLEYRVERGRKPNFLRFYIGGTLQSEKTSTDDSAQGDSRETQVAIEKVLRMSSDMFRHIVVLNTYTEPFLNLKAGDQRDIAEQLLGITILSEKAELVKAQVSACKDAIKAEEFRFRAVEEANKRIVEQIDGLRRRQKLWQDKKAEDLDSYATRHNELLAVDIVVELQAHKALAAHDLQVKTNQTYDGLVARRKVWQTKQAKDIGDLQASLTKKNSIDIAKELQKHREVAEYKQRVKDKAAQDADLARSVADSVRLGLVVEKLQGEIASLGEHRCYACGQHFHDEQHTVVLEAKEAAHRKALDEVAEAQHVQDQIHANRVELGRMPSTLYKTEAEAFRHSSELDAIRQKIDEKEAEVDPYTEQIDETAEGVRKVGIRPTTVYETETEAVQHQAELDNLLVQMTARYADEDPYHDQITDMETKAIQTVDFTEMNRLTRLLEHQKFLQDLLTSKDSFVRKRIIDQNLAALNARLTYYLQKLGLPHSVLFNNDLSVTIEEFGRGMDFGNMSKGESTRVILALSLSFRDLWESLICPVNLLMIDELLDSGMDTAGVDLGLSVLKQAARDRGKSVWLISHRDELISRVDNVLKVRKENGFSSMTEEI